MRIEICGGGAVGLLQQNLRGMRGGITATIESLQSVRRQLTGISGGATGNVSNAISGVNQRIQEENAKLERVQTLEKKTDDFLLHTVAADQQVARTVTQNREQLFSKYSWLRPAGSGIQSWWDERVKDWKRFWSKAGEAIGKVVDGVVTFIKEHAVQLIVGTIGIVIGVALMVLGGAELMAALAVVAKAVAIGTLISGAISAVIALFTGGDVLQAFLDGLADGFMWAGIFAAISGAISAIRSLFAAKTAAQGAATTAVEREAAEAGAKSTAEAQARRSIAQTELNGLKNTRKMDSKFVQHIFKGENGKGLHYYGGDVEGAEGRIIENTREAIRNRKAYKARIDFGSGKSPKLSTFFPDEYSPQQVIDSCNEALENVQRVPGINKPLYYGTADDGLVIGFYYNAEGLVRSAFPLDPAVYPWLFP